MIFEQFYQGCFEHTAYLIGDEETGIAAVVDPQEEVEFYLKSAFTRHQLRIHFVFLTHTFSQFTETLRDQWYPFGVEVYAGKASSSILLNTVQEGDFFEFGNLRLEVLETPGRTPEAISILAYDLKQSRIQPQIAFTGDCFFIGNIGRPELMATVEVEQTEQAEALYHSLHQKLLKLSDEVKIYGTHGSHWIGSQTQENICDTLGQLKKTNKVLEWTNKHSFVEMVTGNPQPQHKANGVIF